MKCFIKKIFKLVVFEYLFFFFFYDISQAKYSFIANNMYRMFTQLNPVTQ